MSTMTTVQQLPKCDLCEKGLLSNDAAYDARTAFGPWAYMCEECWKMNGIGRLGTGYGQRLVVAVH